MLPNNEEAMPSVVCDADNCMQPLAKEAIAFGHIQGTLAISVGLVPENMRTAYKTDIMGWTNVSPKAIGLRGDPLETRWRLEHCEP